MACHSTEIPPLSYFRNAFGAAMEFCLLSFSTSRRFIDGIHQSWQPKQHGLSMFPLHLPPSSTSLHWTKMFQVTRTGASGRARSVLIGMGPELNTRRSLLAVDMPRGRSLVNGARTHNDSAAESMFCPCCHTCLGGRFNPLARAQIWFTQRLEVQSNFFNLLFCCFIYTFAFVP